MLLIDLFLTENAEQRCVYKNSGLEPFGSDDTTRGSACVSITAFIKIT